MAGEKLDSFTHLDAWRVGSALVARCRDEDSHVTVGIWLAEQRVFHAALPGTSADLDYWIERKANTVRRFGVASMEMELRFPDFGNDFYALFGLSPERYTAAGGAVPILVRGIAVGVIAVSGLKSTDDHELALWALQQ